jgi:hypothetical protein
LSKTELKQIEDDLKKAQERKKEEAAALEQQACAEAQKQSKQPQPRIRAKRQRRVLFQEDDDDDDDESDSQQQQQQEGGLLELAKVATSETSNVLQRSSELQIMKRSDGIHHVKYVGSVLSKRAFSGLYEIRQIVLPSNQFQVQATTGSLKDDQDGDSKLPQELPLLAGKSIVALCKHLKEGEPEWINLANCVEKGLLIVCLRLVQGGVWTLSIAIGGKAMDVCHSSALPLDRLVRAPKFQPARWICSALSEVCWTIAPPDNKQPQNIITAKNVYDWTDNYQITCLLETAHKLPDSSSLDITGLLPTLRPYQAAAVKWMLERERNPKPSQEWKLAWIALQNTISPEESSAPSILTLEQWEKSSDRREAVFYCPLVGWLAKSVDQARAMSLGDDDEELVRGGILAESMGLGKTVEVLACILAHKRPIVLPTTTRRELFSNEINEESQVPANNVGDVTEFGNADEDSSSEQRKAKKGVAELSIVQRPTPMNKDRATLNQNDQGPVPVTPDPSADTIGNSSTEARWLNENETILGSCLCGTVADVRTAKATNPIVVCCQCDEPMHMECAGFSNLTVMKRATREVTYREMISHEQWTSWVTRDCRNCPCCVAKKDECIESRGTLIVTPPSILNQWEREIERHILDPTTGRSLKVGVYHGVKKTTESCRNMSSIHPHLLADHDIVLMTFDSLMSDFRHSDENKFVGNESNSNLRKRKPNRLFRVRPFLTARRTRARSAYFFGFFLFFPEGAIRSRDSVPPFLVTQRTRTRTATNSITITSPIANHK